MPKAQANRSKPICRILLADNQAIFRAGIARVLAAEPDISVVGQCSEPMHLPDMVTSAGADILLLAQSLGSAPEATSSAAVEARTRIILIAENGSPSQIGLPRSLHGHLTRQTSAEELLACVRRVHDGERVAAVTKPEMTAGDRIRDSLSNRELQIVGLVVQGCKNRKIAEEIGTSEQVVKNYLRTIYDKTGSSDRLELALFTLHHRTLAEAATRALDSHKAAGA